MEEKIIHVQWDGPSSSEKLGELQGSTDCGVYQIYGGHPVYGSDVLFYIDKASAQTVGDRIAQEGWEFNRDGKRVQVYVGRLSGAFTPSDEEWETDIDLVESLLIYGHAPAYNSKNIKSIADEELRHVHVLNWGTHRDLLAEVSGGRWTSLYDEFPNYGPYGADSNPA